MSNESHITVHNEGDVLILEIQETRISEGRILEALSRELEAVLQDRECSKVLLDLHHVELLNNLSINFEFASLKLWNDCLSQIYGN